MKRAIELIETRKGCAICEETPRYLVMFRGRKFSELYFNLTGYTGGDLPCPGADPSRPVALHFGEASIAAYRRVIAGLNREWAASDNNAERRQA
jgi:hypothetical protein